MTEDKEPDPSVFDELAHFDHRGKNGHGFSLDEEEQSEDESVEEGYLTDELDRDILMHREAHFGGDFARMLEYYAGDFVGIHPEFELERIEYLYTVEKELGKNLAPLILTGAEAEKIAAAKEAYTKLKEIYDAENEKSPIPRLLADIILSEQENPQDELEGIIEQETLIVPELIRLIQSDELYDPLFPGYGMAPAALIYCLGEIKDERAIVPLFEALPKDKCFEEECISHALFSIGEKAKEFLLKVLISRPLTQDNESAAFALSYFAQDPNVALLCFKELKDPLVQKNPALSSYLICNLDSLRSTPHEKELIAFLEDEKTNAAVRKELQQFFDLP